MRSASQMPRFSESLPGSFRMALSSTDKFKVATPHLVQRIEQSERARNPRSATLLYGKRFEDVRSCAELPAPLIMSRFVGSRSRILGASNGRPEGARIQRD